MFQGIGHRVESLIRHSIGPVSLEGLPVGGVRELTDTELRQLKAAGGGR
jgi:16S rRNA U516 pseudouridylate synthase RsuA-like enzyme